MLQLSPHNTFPKIHSNSRYSSRFYYNIISDTFLSAEFDRSTPTGIIIRIRTVLIAIGFIAAGAPFLFTARNPSDGVTILIGLNEFHEFYRADANGERVPGLHSHASPRAVITGRWPGITPTIRNWINVFDGRPLDEFECESHAAL